MNNRYFQSTNAIFEVQLLFFCVCRTKKNLSGQYKLFPLYGISYVTFWREFCRLMTRVLPPYGTSFAALWPSTKKQSAVQKSAAFSRGGGV